MQMAAATCKSLKEKVKDHLPGGKFENVTAEVQIQMKSVIPHNKLPEWIFGYLDWLLKHRPNSTRLANEAPIVYKLNKTSEWLHKKRALEVKAKIEIKFQQKSKTQKRKILTSQIKFRQLVLEQSADKKTFQISIFEGKSVTVDMLMSNLEILIRLENVPEVEEEVEETLTEE
ncbi:unnamed protein product [Mytilus edulis]|uniref:Uncharacterized protein n=1 Tax=Mytilus edulis TaxID=6550 RepID=A0A8S3UL59_MYTED|nr:unnamed protein product [Mytilus edulis]